jgi:hypothetical protein
MIKDKQKRKTRFEVGYDTTINLRIKEASSLAEKMAIIKEANPFHYQFGTKLKPYKPYLTYGENYGIDS